MRSAYKLHVRVQGLRLRMAQSGRSAAAVVVTLSSVAVALGVYTGGRYLLKSPEVTLDPKQRRSPIRDNFAEAEAYKRKTSKQGGFLSSVARRYTKDRHIRRRSVSSTRSENVADNTNGSGVDAANK